MQHPQPLGTDLPPVVLDVVRPASVPSHEARSFTSMGSGHGANEDVASIFPLVVFGARCTGVVLTLANGSGISAQGDVASALAVDAVEDFVTANTQLLDLATKEWQASLTDLLAGAYGQANAGILKFLANRRQVPAQGVALTVVVVLGDWICVAHAGDCRVHRLSMGALEQLTADHNRHPPRVDTHGYRPVRALGLAAGVTPTIHFARLRAGDVVLLASRGLARRLDDEDLVALLRLRVPMQELARILVAAAGERGGGDDMTATVVRVSRLPDRRLPVPLVVITEADMSQPMRLPRHRAHETSRWNARRLSLLALLLAVSGFAAAEWRSRPAGHDVVRAVVASSVARLRAAVDGTLWLARWGRGPRPDARRTHPATMPAAEAEEPGARPAEAGVQ